MARYSVGPIETCLTRTLGPMTILYHRRSGTTHMVSEPVPELLEALAAIGPADAAAVAHHLASAFDLEEGAEPAVAARLAELADLGLVKREA